MTQISILGCGWLGLPLAKALLENSFLVNGSTTSIEKLSVLENSGIQGFQIWFNIPQKDKMSKPYSASFQNSDFKHIKKDGNDVKVLTGIYEGVKGPLDKSNIGLRMLDVSVDKEIVLEREVFKKGYIYIYSGNGLINDEEELISQSAYILDEGKYHIKNISKEPLQLLFAEGVPLNEPIVWRGPIVMNTKEEIIEAYKDLENDNFVK